MRSKIIWMRDMFLPLKRVGVSLIFPYITIIHQFNVCNYICQICKQLSLTQNDKQRLSYCNGREYTIRPLLLSSKPVDNTPTLPPISCIQISRQNLYGRPQTKNGRPGSKDFQLEGCILLSLQMERGFICVCFCIQLKVHVLLRI